MWKSNASLADTELAHRFKDSSLFQVLAPTFAEVLVVNASPVLSGKASAHSDAGAPRAGFRMAIVRTRLEPHMVGLDSGRS